MSDLGGFSLHELFRAEAETHAATLSDGLVRLEGTADASVVEPLMRAAHSIKGAARVVGVDAAVRMAHAMEDTLVAMQKGREPIVPGRIDQLLKGTDLLAALAKVDEAGVAAWCEAKASEIDALVESLRAPAPASQAAAAGSEAQPSGEAAARVEAPTPAHASEESAARAVVPVPAAAAPAPSLPAAAPAAVRQTSVRLTADKLDRLLQLAGETMLESRRLASVREGA
ncbi:MAG: Hpt domain-containing protein, partial [Phycisphaerales bacterium]